MTEQVTQTTTELDPDIADTVDPIGTIVHLS